MFDIFNRHSIMKFIKLDLIFIAFFYTVGCIILYSYGYFSTLFITFLISVFSIILTFIVFLISQESSNQIIDVSTNIAKVQDQLATQLIGQKKGFEEIYDQILEMSKISIEKNIPIKMAFPIISIGSINKKLMQTRDTLKSKYQIFQDQLLSMIQFGIDTEIIINNFLPYPESKNESETIKYFIGIEKIAPIEGEQYYSAFTENIKHFFTSLNNIIFSYIKNEIKSNFKLHLSNNLSMNIIMLENKANPETLMFFMGENELLSYLAEQGQEKFEESIDTYSIALYSQIENICKMTKSLYDPQKLPKKSISLFDKYDPIALNYYVSNICSFLHSPTKLDTRSVAAKISDCLSPLKIHNYQYAKLFKENCSVKLYSFLNQKKTKKNILFIPSASGLFTLFTDKKQKSINEFRFDAYCKICNCLLDDFNIHLISLSGQDCCNKFENKTIPFSYNQSIIDTIETINYVKEKYGDITGGIGFCTGSTILAESFNTTELSNLPIVCWDVAYEVGWGKNVKWFNSIFPEIYVDNEELKAGKEPYEILPGYKGKLLFMHSEDNSQYIQSDFDKLINILEAQSTDYEKHSFQGLGHIPISEQNQSNFKEFIGKIISWLS